MKEFDDILLFEGVREVFLGDGPHVFRVILNPEMFASSLGVDVSVICPDGRPIDVSVERWGRKMRVSFVVGPERREGVYRASVAMGAKHPKRERSFWVIR